MRLPRQKKIVWKSISEFKPERRIKKNKINKQGLLTYRKKCIICHKMFRSEFKDTMICKKCNRKIEKKKLIKAGEE